MPARLRNAVGGGIGAGIGVGLGLGVVGALGGRGLRPVAKAMIRAGMALYDRAAETSAEAAEVAQDLYHEVLDERAAQTAAREQIELRGNGVVPIRSK